MFYNNLYGKKTPVYSTAEAFPIVTAMIDAQSSARTSTKKREYIDLVATFDIETTVTENDGAPRRESGKYSHFNYCFCWQACIGGLLIMGRHVEDWFEFTDNISKYLNGKSIIVYVHNLAFEYNNLAEHFVSRVTDPENELFFRDRVHPLYIRNGNIEYRCSYQLTHKSLSVLSVEVGLEKAADLDYTKPRHSKTPLTSEEIEYCLRDVFNLYTWLDREVKTYSHSINKHAHVCYMPLTQTGYVRYDVRHYFSNTKKGALYNHDNALDFETYNICRAAFRGGDTHANHNHICRVFNDVRHRDFTSAYPAKMVLEKFPRRGFRRFPNCSIRQYNELLESDFAVIATVDLRNLSVKKNMSSYVPVSSCHYISDERVIDNGRVLKADQIVMTCTEIDLGIIASVYDFDIESVKNVIYGRKERLPDELVKIVLKYFSAKTTLKGVHTPEAELEYKLSKEKLNGIYGCAATRLDHSRIVVDPNTLESLVVDGEYKPGRVLPYQIGVYITAYLRADLNYFKTALGENFLYCDTDSIFYLPDGSFEKLVDKYNRKNRARLKALYTTFGTDLVTPKNPKGERQYLGEFMADDDYIIDRFITCGAKRYVTERTFGDHSRVDMTFAGVGDTKAIVCSDGSFRPGENVEYLQKRYKKDIFTLFADFPKTSYVIPSRRKNQKLTHYIERGDFVGSINDGITTETVTAKSSMVLTPIDTTLSLEPSLMDFVVYDNLIWTMY